MPRGAIHRPTTPAVVDGIPLGSPPAPTLFLGRTSRAASRPKSVLRMSCPPQPICQALSVTTVSPQLGVRLRIRPYGAVPHPM